MRYSTYEAQRARTVLRDHEYNYLYYLLWDYSLLDKCLSRKKAKKKSSTYSEVYMMFDTETSKGHRASKGAFGRFESQHNHVVAWTLSIRAFNTNIVTLRGTKPTELVHCFRLIRSHLQAEKFFIFAHNLNYDWQFTRRFIMRELGEPTYQLNVKQHYPVLIEFGNGMILRDSLILAAVSLQRWADNLEVEHRKAVGSWDYDIIRNQNHTFTDEELHYIENDTLAGVECLNKLARMLNDAVCTLPLTNTGIIRRITQRIGKKHYAKRSFTKQAISFEEYQIMEIVFHGGYTHANRYMAGYIWKDVICYDIKSSYPFCMMCYRFPMGKWSHMESKFTIEDILSDSKENAYIFHFAAVNIRLKDPMYPMPALQMYKCDDTINAIEDNGYILNADYLSIWLTEVDLGRIRKLYKWDHYNISKVMCTHKEYLPQWYRDIVWGIFKEKCELEHQIKDLGEGDPVLYSLKKANLNSLYGMMVQKKVTQDIKEQYQETPLRPSGENYLEEVDLEEAYYQKDKSYNNILPYAWGVYVTAYAKEHLYEIAESCLTDIHDWIYCDTDSIYSSSWDLKKVEKHNAKCDRMMEKAGYPPFTIGEREFHLGAIDFDGKYPEFITQGSKRYAAKKDDGSIKITVAGVPKKAGSKALKQLEDFQEGYIFRGEDTGKKMLTYMYHEIDIDDNGNEYADSIDMNPADYTLSVVKHITEMDELYMEEVLLPIIEMDF